MDLNLGNDQAISPARSIYLLGNHSFNDCLVTRLKYGSAHATSNKTSFNSSLII